MVDVDVTFTESRKDRRFYKIKQHVTNKARMELPALLNDSA